MTHLKIEKVSKQFGKMEVLKEINLDFRGNKIYGLLGRNGAGKTTLVNIMTQRIQASHGEVSLDGESVVNNDQILQKISSTVVKDTLYNNMKIIKLMKLSAEIYEHFDIPYALELASKFGLDVKKRVGNLSTGYRAILKVILTMASKADVLIFDEPVLGLDANHRDLFYRELIALYEDHSCLMILCTHLIEEVEHIIEDVVIIKEGEILVAQDIASLTEKAYVVSGIKENIQEYIKDKRIIESREFGKQMVATIFESEKKLNEISRLNLTIESIELNQLFIQLTN